MQFQVHWLSITIWRNEAFAVQIWDAWFKRFLGSLHPTGHGGRGFRNMSTALVGSKLYSQPIAKADEQDQYVHLEFPGIACEAMPNELIRNFLVFLQTGDQSRITRLDLAWDAVPFTPLEVKEAVETNQMRSRMRRESLLFTVEPMEKRDDGRIGTSSLRLGKPSSERMLRVYDKRGPVRVELQLRAIRADKVTWDVLINDPTEWPKSALGHLRDYVDFETNGKFLDWWEKFINATPRNRTTVTDAREKELERLTEWLMTQVAPTYSAVVDAIGKDMMEAMLKYGRNHRGHRFDSILEVLEKENHEWDQA